MTFRCAVAAGLLHLLDLLDDARVVAGQVGVARDDHVDLVGARGDRLARLLELDLHRGLPGREAGRHRGDVHAGALERARGRRPPATGRRRPRRTTGSRDGSAPGTPPWPRAARPCPGVSWPSSVVRSTIETARRIALQLGDSALIERLPSPAARSSMPTRSTGVTRRRMERSVSPRRASEGVIAWGQRPLRIQRRSGLVAEERERARQKSSMFTRQRARVPAPRRTQENVWLENEQAARPGASDSAAIS